MKYKIIDVEGIGPVYAEKLLAAGIVDTDILLEKCANLLVVRLSKRRQASVESSSLLGPTIAT